MTSTFLYVLCIIFVLVIFFFLFIYSINQKVRSSYFFGFNCWFTSIMFIDNLLRCFPAARGDGIDSKDEQKVVSSGCKAQAFFLALCDKLTVLSLVVFAIISFADKYDGLFKENIKKILIISIIIIIFFSLVLTIVFYFTKDISDRSQFCYVETKSDIKKVLDSIVTGIFGLIDLFFTILICNCDKSSIVLVINLITYIYVIFLINRILPFDGSIKDIIYILLCLIANLLMVIDKEVSNYIKKVFHCAKNDIKEIENDNDNENDNGNLIMTPTNLSDKFNDGN